MERRKYYIYIQQLALFPMEMWKLLNCKSIRWTEHSIGCHGQWWPQQLVCKHGAGNSGMFQKLSQPTDSIRNCKQGHTDRSCYLSKPCKVSTHTIVILEQKLVSGRGALDRKYAWDQTKFRGTYPAWNKGSMLVKVRNLFTAMSQTQMRCQGTELKYVKYINELAGGWKRVCVFCF